MATSADFEHSLFIMVLFEKVASEWDKGMSEGI